MSKMCVWIGYFCATGNEYLLPRLLLIMGKPIAKDVKMCVCMWLCYFRDTGNEPEPPPSLPQLRHLDNKNRSSSWNVACASPPPAARKIKDVRVEVNTTNIRKRAATIWIMCLGMMMVKCPHCKPTLSQKCSHLMNTQQ